MRLFLLLLLLPLTADAVLKMCMDFEFAFDFTSLMRGDADSRAKYYGSGITNGWMTRNEARISENLNPLPGLDEPLRPLNMVEESDAEDIEADAEALEPPAQENKEPKEPADDANAMRLQALVQQNAARLARRISKHNKFTVADAELVAASLGIEPCEVNKWSSAGVNFDEAALEAAFTQLGALQ